MKLKIQNKVKFAAFIIIIGLIGLALGEIAYYVVSSKFFLGNEQEQVILNANKIEEERKQDAETEAARKKDVVFLEHRNEKYRYSVRYPESWHIDSTESESELIKPDAASGIDYPLGGQTFWSNYANINDYGPQNKPDDFRLLGLTLYQGADETIDDFAKKIGVLEDAINVDFETEKKLIGSQYIIAGLTENDLRITVILKNDKLFYVFKTAFINGDEQAAEVMENIVKSFELQPA